MKEQDIEKEIKANVTKLQTLQKQQASLEGELKQVNNQIASFGLGEDVDIDQWLEDQEKELDQQKEVLEDLLTQIQKELDKVENKDEREL